MPAYFFAAMFKKSKVGTAPANAPTVDVIDVATNTLVVSGGTPGTLSNMAGVYTYTYTGAAANLIAMFKTADTTVDAQHVPSYTPQVISDNLDVAVSSRNATTPPTASANATAVRSELATELARVDVAVSTRLASASYSAAPTAAANADAVWDELIAGHAIATSTGALLSSAGAAADPLLNSVPGSYASGTAGAALGRIGSAGVTIVSPVADSGEISLIYGDDYLSADARALTFTGTNWPTITGGTIALIVSTSAAVVSLAGVVTGAAACYVALTSTQVNSLGVGVWTYDLQVTLSNAHVVTLQQGTLLVQADVR